MTGYLSEREVMRRLNATLEPFDPYADIETAPPLDADGQRRFNLEMRRGLVEGVEPAADLLARELPEPRWVIPGLLPEGCSLLVGKPKGGKSWMVDALAIAVAGGGHALGAIPVETGDVLLKALEDPQRRLQDRLRKLLDGEAAPERLDYATTWPRLDQGGLQRIEEWLDAHPEARLVIIDTLKRVKPLTARRGGSAYDDDYDAITPLAQLANGRGVGILVVHHQRKLPADDWVDTINASTGLAAAADTLLGLFRDRGRADAFLNVTGRDVDEVELALSFEPSTGLWSLLGDGDTYRLGTRRAKYLDLLDEAGEPLTPKEVATLTGDNPNTARQTLLRMARDGQLHAEDGNYSVPLSHLSPVSLTPSDSSDTSDTGDTSDESDG